MHTHQSIFTEKGTNLFYNADDPHGLSEMAYGFIAGQIEHARGLAAIVAPTVNSYKRIVPGYEAPVYICWAQINRSAMIRIPQPGVGRELSTRVELRFPDPSCNPYLAFAVMLAAGLDGMENNQVCPPPVNNLNIYEMGDDELSKLGIAQLPGSLAEALDELAGDQILKEALGAQIYEAFVRAKWAEWDAYRTKVMDWEVETYLEIA
jgi:glutamine synthetase